MRKFIVAGMLLLIFLASSTALAGVIKLKNGDEVSGDILELTGKQVVIKTAYGTLTYPADKIESIKSPVRVELKAAALSGELVWRNAEEVRIKSLYAEKPVSIPARDVVNIKFLDVKREKKEEPEPKPKPEEKEPRRTGDINALRRKAHAHLQQKQWQEAIDTYKKILEISPDDSNALYNSACAYSLLGKKAEAVDYLRKAVEAGFIDFAHIKRDSDLDNIREEEGYKKLFVEKDKLLAGYADKIIEKYKKKLGDEYKVIKDQEYKLIVISNACKDTLDGLVRGLRGYAECHWKDFFKHKPEYYITVLIPKDSEEYRKKFGGRSGAAGFYNPGTKTLTVNLATGAGTMIHEFTHALHYVDMEGLNQRHPIWILEGFGTLYEQCHRREGSGYGLLNWRLPKLKSAIEGGTCFPMKDFISSSSSLFRRDTSLSYAMARYIFYFLQEKKLLRKWYAKYRENYKNDKTGLKTLEEVYGKGIEEIEKEWLEFMKPLEYGRGRANANTPYMGVSLEETDDGLKAARVVEGSPADKAGLESGDIILKMQDKEIKSLQDLQGVISKHKIGDEIKLIVKRGDEEKEITLKLGKK